MAVVTWIGHSCFKIEKEGYTIILDPYADGSVPGFLPIREKANLVLCSHEHTDHNGRSCVTIEDPDLPCPYTITEMTTFHDDAEGTLRGMNTVHILECRAGKIVHLGDLGTMLTDEQLALVRNCSLLMIPVGGYYTIDADTAAALVDRIHPNIVLPMHYHNEFKRLDYDVLDCVERFTEQMVTVIHKDSSCVTMHEHAKDQPTEVMILRPQNC